MNNEKVFCDIVNAESSLGNGDPLGDANYHGEHNETHQPIIQG
jgi:hypothetical protein